MTALRKYYDMEAFGGGESMSDLYKRISELQSELFKANKANHELETKLKSISQVSAPDKVQLAIEDEVKVTWEQYDSAINEIGRLQERLKEAEEEIRNLQKQDF